MVILYVCGLIIFELLSHRGHVIAVPWRAATPNALLGSQPRLFSTAENILEVAWPAHNLLLIELNRACWDFS